MKPKLTLTKILKIIAFKNILTHTHNNSRNNINDKAKNTNSSNVNKLKNYPSFSNLCIDKENLLKRQKLNSTNNNYNNFNYPINHTLNYNSRGNLIYDKQKSLINESNNEKYNNIFEKT